MKTKHWLYQISFAALFAWVGCKRNDEVAYAGNATLQGKLQYTQAVSGQLTDLPTGQSFSVFLNGAAAPYYTGSTTLVGYYSYHAPAAGSYRLTFKRVDSVLQFNSAIVKKADLDTLRKNEYDTIGYAGTLSQQLVRDQIAEGALTLQPTITGIRITATDANGSTLSNVSLCVYSNKTYYDQNYPNCGGSLKYLSCDKSGIALLAGLLPATTYYVNAQASIGNYAVSNHYSADAQKVVTTGKGTINPQTITLK